MLIDIEYLDWMYQQGLEAVSIYKTNLIGSFQQGQAG